MPNNFPNHTVSRNKYQSCPVIFSLFIVSRYNSIPCPDIPLVSCFIIRKSLQQKTSTFQKLPEIVD
ncbi:MAG: hypothetical protein KGD68_11990 [Candidatus Lokiarchaeota archaeon]|nr:hypothetical protein [Candidatus Lokiarchaeota archaeon]